MKKKSLYIFISILFVIFNYINSEFNIINLKGNENVSSNTSSDLNDIILNAEYEIVNNNEPVFEDKYKILESFEIYEELDYLGRAVSAFANIGKDLMPTEERGSISGVKPSGWNQAKYDIIDGKYLYNRCHLIGYQLTGENANERNLITCTRQMNVGAMLDYENKIASYIKETGNHVLYRSTPYYDGTNLLASYVHLEALSVEDNGEGIKFNVKIYNIQDGIKINYENGESELITNE